MPTPKTGSTGDKPAGIRWPFSGGPRGDWRPYPQQRQKKWSRWCPVQSSGSIPSPSGKVIMDVVAANTWALCPCLHAGLRCLEVTTRERTSLLTSTLNVEVEELKQWPAAGKKQVRSQTIFVSIFYRLEVVGRGSETQLQVGKKIFFYCRPNILKIIILRCIQERSLWWDFVDAFTLFYFIKLSNFDSIEIKYFRRLFYNIYCLEMY